MNRNNNKDLYQIIGVNKNASQQEINSLVLKTSPRDDSEVGKALMVLTDPQKRIEYDRIGWKDEWERDWQKERDFRNSIFKSIQNYKHHYDNTEEYTPDGHKVWVAAGIHLNPNLWTPFQERSLGWVDKIWRIYGENWKQELEGFRDKMLVALDEAWEKIKKTPALDLWEAVEGGNCAECGKMARLRWKDRDRHSDKVYCSRDCAFEDVKIKIDYEFSKENKKPNFICMKCHQKDKDVCQMEDGKYYHKSCFSSKQLEKLKSPPRQNKNHLIRLCDNCHQEIKEYEDENGSIISGVGSVDQDGNRHDFCSRECSEKFRGGEWKTVVRKNAFAELLKWMEKEGITNIGLDPDSGKLVVEYGKNNSKIIENDNLTSEQREIKNLFQQIGKNSLNRQEVIEMAKGKDKGGDNKWVGSVIGITIAVLAITLIGVIVYNKNKKKGY